MSDDQRQTELDPGGEALPETQEPAAASEWVNWLGLAGVLLVSIVAGIGRLLKLDSLPAGLAEAEMQHGLLARQGGDFGLQWALENTGPLAFPLVLVISWVGALTGYDVETPRIAAALFGAGSILFTGLWLHRAMGPIWGLASAAVLAGSFWHILFSRLATGQIVGACAFAAFCWLLTEASKRRDQSAMPWYLLAGLAAGIGFLATPALRLLPFALLVVLAISLWRMRTESDSFGARNWLFSSAAAYLVISPYLIAHRGELALWTPLAETPGLPNEDPVTIPTLATAVIDTMTALVMSGDSDRGLNLPADPWFGILMLPWALIGVLGLISASNAPHSRDRFMVGLAIGTALLLGITARDAGHPGQLLVISPALAGLAVFGFRTVLRWARVQTVRYALVGLIAIGVAGQAGMAVQQYIDEWATEPETKLVFHADVINALIAIESLETDEPVFVNLSGHETALDYFRTPLRRHAFDGAHVLPFPDDETGYLIATGEPSLAPEFEELLEFATSATQLREEYNVRTYRLDARLREQMPLSAPTIPYPGGPTLYGSSDPSRTDDDAVRFLVAWNTQSESPPLTMEARLRTTGSPELTSSTEIELPANPLRTRLFQVLLVKLEIPQYDSPTDVEVRLLRADGSIRAVAGMDEDGYLVLNRYTFVE